MTRSCIAIVFALMSGVALPAQGLSAPPVDPQRGLDLSGRWNREAVSAGASGPDSATWGARVEIDQSGVYVTVRQPGGKSERFRLDGKETADVLSIEGCKNTTRITKAQADRDRVTITAWIVAKPGCFHGETDCEPLIAQAGEIALGQVRGGPRRLESITVLFRDGDVLTVDSTRATPGGTPTSTTTTYRK